MVQVGEMIRVLGVVRVLIMEVQVGDGMGVQVAFRVVIQGEFLILVSLFGKRSV